MDEQLTEIKQLLRDGVGAALKSGGDPRESVLKALNEGFCAGVLAKRPKANADGSEITVTLNSLVHSVIIDVDFGAKK